MARSQGSENRFPEEVVNLCVEDNWVQASKNKKVTNKNIESHIIQKENTEMKLEFNRIHMKTMLLHKLCVNLENNMTQNGTVEVKEELNRINMKTKLLQKLCANLENKMTQHGTVEMKEELKPLLKQLNLLKNETIEKLTILEDPRNVDTLVDFIEDDTSKSVKTKVNKRKNRSRTVVNTIKIEDIEDETPASIVIAEVEENTFDIPTMIDIGLNRSHTTLQRQEDIGDIEEVEERMDHMTIVENEKQESKIEKTDVVKIQIGQENKEEMAGFTKCIFKKEALISEQRRQTDKIVECKSEEMTKLLAIIQSVEDEKSATNFQITDIDAQMLELKEKKVKLTKKQNDNQMLLTKVSNKKKRLEDFISSTLDKNTVELAILENEVKQLKEKLAECTYNIASGAVVSDEYKTKPNPQLLEFINKKIAAKEQELECPVCFETAVSPMFMCSEQHLVCSHCRPRLRQCPECRVDYGTRERRHRYAERAGHELRGLRLEREALLAEGGEGSTPGSLISGNN